MWNTSGTAQERSREIFPQTEEFFDVTDTYPFMERDAEKSSEQLSNIPTKPRRSKDKLILTWSLIAMKSTDIFCWAALVFHGTHT